jgi:hypothetical protein
MRVDGVHSRLFCFHGYVHADAEAVFRLRLFCPAVVISRMRYGVMAHIADCISNDCIPDQYGSCAARICAGLGVHSDQSTAMLIKGPENGL